ncbi:MAG: Ldh family oxidoreductase [Tannerellaceae bacterium]|jgi:ureidoglycolate dehydrogenase (NAD+)|nr:Ldh family oxidoreductase [Tannerellaceae bacterium]
MGELYYLVERQSLSDLSTKMFCSYGVPEEDARILSDTLIRSDMRGVKSHGLVRVPDYVRFIGTGIWNKQTNVEIIKESGATTTIDGHNGIAAVICNKAVEITKRKAIQTGIAYTAVRGGNHFGEAGLWSTLLCDEKEGIGGFAATSTVQISAAPGSIVAATGSNPFSFAFPAGKFSPVCLDIAVGTMAAGKIWEYKRLGKPLPEKSFIGPDGNYVTDANKYDIKDYTMVPFGNHKGYGLGVIMEIMTSFLAGSTFNIRRKNKPLSNHAFMAINIGSFTEYDEFIAQMEQYIEHLHSLPVREGEHPVLYPGEIESGKEAKAEEEGVPIPAKVFEDLSDISKAKGINVEPFRKYTATYDA